MVEKESLGQRVRRLRTERKMTQKDLADRVSSADVTYLSKIENDRLEHPPSIKVIQDISRALGVDEIELMDLANRLPPILDVLAKDRNALRFFRRATNVVRDPAEWDELLDFLERRREP